MFSDVPVSHSLQYEDTQITLQTGLLAQQANCAVLATMGETTVLAAVVIGKETKSDYFPLQVIYEERLYASGKIKGSRFIKREGKPSENAVLTGRMVDRSLRSLFDKNTRSEVQVVITVLSVDEIYPPDTLAVLAASAALNISTTSFKGPVSSVRIGQVDGANVVSPSYPQMQNSTLDMVVSGEGYNIMMVEAGASIVDESVLNDSLDLANKNLLTLTNFQSEFVTKALQTLDVSQVELVVKQVDQKYHNYWLNFKSDLEKVLFAVTTKNEKAKALNEYTNYHTKTIQQLSDLALPLADELDSDFKQKLTDIAIINDEVDSDIANLLLSLFSSFSELSVLKNLLEEALNTLIQKIVKENILQQEKRLDGRGLDEVRKIICQVRTLPRTHGSSLFMRGETQVLNVLTLGTSRDAQLLDDMEDFEEQTKRYIHHYNFPAYSVGETGRYFGPGRREIGHGALAEKALLPVLPSEQEFPYTIRLVSECLGSNGSTSMASTCASTLSLMQAGVPIKEMVAGIAMGLVIDSNTGAFKVLTDIQGSEDHYGDMDFKVAGTEAGITAIQLDNKASGLTVHILKVALLEAKVGRLYILDRMREVMSSPNQEISIYAPGVEVIDVPYEKIGDVIGPSGKVIKGIISKYQVDVDIEDNTGKTFIYGKDREQVAQAKSHILKMIRDYTKGDLVNGKVFRIETYGAFVKIDETDKEGMIHISQMSNKRVAKVEDVVKLGQEITAKVVDVNDKGQISLSLKI
ncbi:MAG: polyribonucleotide nucleotidyltransferase [Patescibacteria group bacterium]